MKSVRPGTARRRYPALTVVEVPIVAGVLCALVAIASAIWPDASPQLFIVCSWLIGLALAWLAACALRDWWIKSVAGVVIAAAFIAAGAAIAQTAPAPPSWVHVSGVTFAEEPAVNGVRLTARVEFENDSDAAAQAIVPVAWLFAKPEDAISIDDGARRVRALASAAAPPAVAEATPHQLHHIVVAGPVVSQAEAADELVHGAVFFVAGTVSMTNARAASSAPFCAYAGATQGSVLDTGGHDCPP